MKTFKPYFFIVFIATMILSCGSSAILTIPLENIDTSPIKTADLTLSEKQHWGHLDLLKDTIPGMSVDKAYAEIIKNKKGKKVIVAVVDSGIDIDHEDLNDVIWTNKGEIPNNGKDDDKNGYVDDVHGWNFLGDGYNEQLEYVRILAKGDTSNPNYARAEEEYLEEFNKYNDRLTEYSKLQNDYNGYKSNYEQFLKQITDADLVIAKYLEKNDYTKDAVDSIQDFSQSIKQSVAIMKYAYSIGLESAVAAKKEINDGLTLLNEDIKKLNETLEVIHDRLNYHLNKDLKGRVNGDDPDDMSTKFYGNGNIKPVKKKESHGTHVAGIIAAERYNGLGVNGVANHVVIMPIRTVPNGDEYDKDVALAIRYAVDNGAKVINGSFGKYYATHSDWVRDAITYAGKHDVLFVNAAGNEGEDLDVVPVYPNDQINNGPEISDNFITVGALGPKYGTNMVAEFSNYGKINVDVFAPGAKIYSTTPENEYDTKSGTSMAAPAVAGVAALIRSYFPRLTASQVKHILMDSGLPIKTKVIVGGDPDNIKPFTDLTKSGKMVNAFNALIMASQMAK
ncbi:S8 family peptidase [Yeosuana sp.]|uniref:S8 family peptidase n=1 Tax=Yeosuana sp. TaxID=2529388 RepID=UPI004054F420